MFDVNVALFISVVAAVLSTIGLFLFGLVDYKQWRGISKIEKKVEAFEQQDIGASFGEWLTSKEDDKPNSITNLEVCARLVGHQIAQSFSMGVKGVMSGDARRMRAIEGGVSEIVQDQMSPNQKAVIDLAKKVGESIGFDVSPSEVAFVLSKIGLNLKNDGHEGSGQTSW